MVDIEDLRLPVFMTRLDYYFGDFDMTFAAFTNDDSTRPPLSALTSGPIRSKSPEEEIPGEGVRRDRAWPSRSMAVSPAGTSPLYYADIYDDQPYVEISQYGDNSRRALRQSRL